MTNRWSVRLYIGAESELFDRCVRGTWQTCMVAPPRRSSLICVKKTPPVLTLGRRLSSGGAEMPIKTFEDLVHQEGLAHKRIDTGGSWQFVHMARHHDNLHVGQLHANLGRKLQPINRPGILMSVNTR